MARLKLTPLLLLLWSAGWNLGAGSAAAQRTADSPVLDDASPLVDYLTYAERNNPGLHAAREHWQAAAEKIRQAGSLPDPQLSFGYFAERVETRVGPQRFRIGLSQTIPWFGKLSLRGQVAEQQAQATRQTWAVEREEVHQRVKELYYESYYLQRAVTIAQENIDLLRHLEGVAQANYTSGRGLQSAVLRVQIELGSLEERRASLRDRQLAVAARLNAELGRSMSADTLIPLQVSVPHLDLSLEQLRRRLREENPRLHTVQAQLAAAEAAAKLAARDGWPDLTLGLQYIDTGEALDPALPGSGKDPLIATLGFKLPLWRGKYRGANEEARHRVVAGRHQVQDLESQLSAELADAVAQTRDAERRYDLYTRDLVPMAAQSLEVTLRAFTAGNIGFLDMIDAERTLLEFKLAAERALADRGRSLARIEKLVGQPLGGLEGTSASPAQWKGEER